MEKQTSWHEDWPSPQGMALSLCIHTQIQMEKSPLCTKISLIDRKKQPSRYEKLALSLENGLLHRKKHCRKNPFDERMAKWKRKSSPFGMKTGPLTKE